MVERKLSIGTTESPNSLPNLQVKFDAGIEASRNLLFNLASQVVENYPHRGWHLLIGDDTSGRLVTRFVRKVLVLQDINLPIVYLCSSQETRKKVSEHEYAEYLRQVATYYGHPKRVLFVTETLGTGRTASFMNKLLERQFPEVDFAFLASHYIPPPRIGVKHVYIGGLGKEAGDLVYQTFENAIETDLKKASRSEFIRQFVPERFKPWVFRRFPIPRTSVSYPLTNLVPAEKPTLKF